jgi:hypothetical protein
MENQNNTFTGLDVIYQFPFNKLIISDKAAREHYSLTAKNGSDWGHIDGFGKINLPIGFGAMTTIFSLEHFIEWYRNFVENKGYEPIFTINPNGEWYNLIEVTNKEFKELQQQQSDCVSKFYKELNYKGD